MWLIRWEKRLTEISALRVVPLQLCGFREGFSSECPCEHTCLSSLTPNLHPPIHPSIHLFSQPFSQLCPWAGDSSTKAPETSLRVAWFGLPVLGYTARESGAWGCRWVKQDRWRVPLQRQTSTPTLDDKAA